MTRCACDVQEPAGGTCNRQQEEEENVVQVNKHEKKKLLRVHPLTVCVHAHIKVRLRQRGRQPRCASTVASNTDLLWVQ